MIYLVEGWTGDVDYALKADGVAFDLTGATVEMKAFDKANVALAFAGTTSVTDAPGGNVRFSPASSDLTAVQSPLSVRFKVTLAGGKIVFFPNGGPELWIVKK